MSRYGVVLILAVFAHMASCQAADWPQFRGLNRDGKSPETGLLKTWPEGGPRLVRAIGGLGEGYSSPSTARGSVYITGWAHPVISDGKLYLRWNDRLYVYDIRE